MDNKNPLNKLNCSRKSCQPVEVPTKDELTALTALRDIKRRVREIKKMLSEISSRGKDVEAKMKKELESEISQLKIEWEEWEKKKDYAARERMILLGHEKP